MSDGDARMTAPGALQTNADSGVRHAQFRGPVSAPAQFSVTTELPCNGAALEALILVRNRWEMCTRDRSTHTSTGQGERLLRAPFFEL